MSNTPPRGFAGLTKRHIFVLIVLAIITAIAVAYSMGVFAPLMANAETVSKIDADEVKPLPVNVQTIAFVDSISQSRNYTGTIRARQRSDLGFEVPGRVVAVLVDEGSKVKKDQVLAQLDTETLLAQKSATMARHEQAKSVLRELNVGPRIETIRAATANMDSAQSQFNNAELNLKRRTKIRSALSDEEYDQAVFAQKTAKANLDAARERLSELQTGTRQERVDAQISAVKQLKASLTEIDVAISKASLIAPFDGIVTRRYLDPGSIAPASVPIIKLVDQENLEAWIGLPVSLASTIEIGSEHGILVDDRTLKATAAAKIGELDPTTQTQTILFKLDPTSSQAVVSGQICEIAIESSVESSGFWIPNSALTKGVRGLWSVMVIVPESGVEGFRIEKRGIDIIKTDSSRVLAKGTLESGDQIIVDGTHRVAEGQLVIPNQ